MFLWQSGAAMILYIIGLEAIPKELLEAASIDGAGAWRRFRRITLPLLTPIILFNLIVGVIGNFQYFAPVFVMTQGGPNKATLFFVFNVYRTAFEYFEFGYASALTVVLFFLIAPDDLPGCCAARAHGCSTAGRPADGRRPGPPSSGHAVGGPGAPRGGAGRHLPGGDRHRGGGAGAAVLDGFGQPQDPERGVQLRLAAARGAVAELLGGAHHLPVRALLLQHHPGDRHQRHRRRHRGVVDGVCPGAAGVSRPQPDLRRGARHHDAAVRGVHDPQLRAVPLARLDRHLRRAHGAVLSRRARLLRVSDAPSTT